MIGNDVIDLALAKKESNWRRSGFLNKVFTANEQLQIRESENPENRVWNLWSRKEAAYKIYNRQTGIMAFIPHRLECFDLEEKDGIAYGMVICGTDSFLTKTISTSDCIETVAVIDATDFDKIKYLDAAANVVKINNIPHYFNRESQSLKPMSKSHHGRFEKWVTL